MAFKVVEKDFESFFRAPFEVYPKTSPYVSLMKADLKRFLDPKQNPLLNKFGRGTYFSVLEDGRPVGRISAHIHDASNGKFNKKLGYFGFFDCDERAEVGRLLLKAAEDWNRQQGMKEISGNFNMTAMQQIGVMVSGFENTAYTDQLYSPPQIAEHLRANGYQAEFPAKTFEIDLSQLDEETLIRDKHRKLLESGEFKFQDITFSNTRDCLGYARETLNDGFRDNPMFVPVSKEEFDFQAKDMMLVMDRKISVIMKYGQEAVGTLICIPDLNPFLKATDSRIKWNSPSQFLKHRLNPNRAVIIFYSVKQAYHNRGINALMLHRMVKNLKARGYKSLGLTWIADVNPASLRQTEFLKAKVLHEINLFRKAL